MKKALLGLLLILGCFLVSSDVIEAQIVPPTVLPVATDSGEMIDSTEGKTLPFSLPVLSQDNIAVLNTPIQNELMQIISSQQLGVLSPTNFLQHAIHLAVNRGISINTIVFILLFPLISTVIAIARHIVGLSGFSMFAPAALAVALLSIGIVPGSALFVSVIVLATVAKGVLPYFKLPYMSRTAILLWFVSLGMFGLLLLSTYIPFLSLSIPNLFALLILILLSENFLEIQTASNPWVAIQRAVETFILGLFCAFILDARLVQAAVLLYPEIFLISVAVANFLSGKYLGLRLTEWFRFRSLMETEE